MDGKSLGKIQSDFFVQHQFLGQQGLYKLFTLNFSVKYENAKKGIATVSIIDDGKYLVYVIGNSTIRGTHFSTESVFTNMCKEIGFKFEKKFSRPYYSYRMSTKRNIQSNKINEDIFLIFKK